MAMTDQEALTLIERVRALHRPAEHQLVSYTGPDGDWVDVENGPVEVKCSCTPQGMLPYPCPTVIALDTPVLSDAGSPLLPVKVYEPKHPLATGRCENCDGEMVYNLAANIRRHSAETECTDPWPATPGIGRD